MNDSDLELETSQPLFFLEDFEQLLSNYAILNNNEIVFYKKEDLKQFCIDLFGIYCVRIESDEESFVRNNFPHV
jgi:hypothetical protein